MSQPPPLPGAQQKHSRNGCVTALAVVGGCSLVLIAIVVCYLVWVSVFVYPKYKTIDAEMDKKWQSGEQQ